MTAVFLQGNSRDVLAGLPADYFHCAVTSPPYFGLRRYNGGEEDWGAWKGQLGNEPTPDLYIQHLVQICREVKRVLRPDGVFWLNIGDSWASGKGTCFNPGGGATSLEGHGRLKEHEAYPLNRGNKSDLEAQGMKPLDMVLIPSLLALALREDGWYLRSQVVWGKNNPMPESVNGWRFSCHRVKIKEYENMQTVWKEKHRGEDWPFSLQKLSDGESSPGKVSVQPQREGEASSPRSVCQAVSTSSYSEINTRGVDNSSEIERESEEPETRTQTETSGISSQISLKPQGTVYGGASKTVSEMARVSSRLLPHYERQSCINAESGQEKNGDKGNTKSSDCDRVAGDSTRARKPMPLLRSRDQVNDRPRNSFEQGGSAYGEQRSSGLPKLQQSQEGQDSDLFVDCPGCPKCLPNDGYVLRKGSWRPTDSYEIILMLAKTDSYFCDKEAVLEPIAPSTIGRGKVDFGGAKGREYQPDENDPNFRNGSEQWGREYDYHQSNGNGGRNLRSVWEFPTKPYSGAHFATYPPRLVELCVKSSTSEKGCCPECGASWARVIEKPEVPHDGETDCKNLDPQGSTRRLALMRQAARERGEEYSSKSNTVSWKPTCSCPPALSEPCRVLDPFSGAGTTALVCERLGLDSFSIDTSTEYIQLAQTRLQEDEDKRVAEFIKQAKKK